MNGPERRHHPWIAVLLLLPLLGLPAAVAPLSAQTQELYTFSATAMLGVGGSPDAEPGDSISNSAVQLGFSFVSESRTHVAFRLGRMDLGSDEFFNSLRGADLTYLTVAGEYRFNEGYYDSGIYLGLGGYQVDGIGPDGTNQDDSGVGIVLGLTGEFQVNRRWGVQLEVSGHYADLDESNVFLIGHAGVAFHF